VAPNADKLHVPGLVPGQQIVVAPGVPHDVGRLGRLDNLYSRSRWQDLRRYELRTRRHEDTCA